MAAKLKVCAMSDKLQEICTKRLEDVNALKAQRPENTLIAALPDAPRLRGFRNALIEAEKSGRTGLIAEVKQASPSQGIIRADFAPVALGESYAAAGADCLSVLTEPHWFKGDDAYLRDIRARVSCPILRKDFTVDAYQIYESRLLGADCILLIMAALDDVQATDFYNLAKELGLDVLVEVHNREELDRALRFTPDMVGVNNRNLKTLQVDLQTSHDLAGLMPQNCLRISESGIKTATEISALRASGYSAFLVGESLLRQGDVAEAVKNLVTPL